MIRKIARAIKNDFLNGLGFHTDYPILVIESDDWGSIRMPSREVLEKLTAIGDSAEKDPFLKYDRLECENDLLQLYSCLSEFADINKRHPCFTANFAVANPKFEDIDGSTGSYHWEPFWNTYVRYYGRENHVMKIIKQGIEQGIFYPQLHAREHLNVKRWMNDLALNRTDTKKAFELNLTGIGASFTKQNKFGYMDALNYDRPEEKREIEKNLNDAFKLFEKAFGYPSKTFVASCYTWSDAIEKVLARNKVTGMQTQCWQKKFLGKGTTGEYHIFHFAGQKSKNGITYSIRNCNYEPVIDGMTEETIQKCIEEIEEAFRNRKPAVINTHRVNYVGGIEKEHAEFSRYGLKKILKTIQKKYPNVVFMSSAELIELMNTDK